MTLETVARLLAGLLLIAANAFFVAVEFSLTRLRGLELSGSSPSGSRSTSRDASSGSPPAASFWAS